MVKTPASHPAGVSSIEEESYSDYLILPPDVPTAAENPADIVETKQEILPAVKMVKLKTIDGAEIEVEEAIAKEFLTLKSSIEDEGYSDHPIPVPKVPSAVLVEIIEYCRKKFEFDAKAKALDGDNAGGKRIDDLKAFEEAFVKDMTNEDIKTRFLAAYILNIKDYSDFLCRCMANRIKNKSVSYVRALFGIKNDFSKKEEAALRAECFWAFEDFED